MGLMPAGIGYGPLPVPMGLQQPDPLQNALMGVPSGLMGPEHAAMIPPPVMPEEQLVAMPVPSGLQDAPAAAPVPLWLQEQLAQREQLAEQAPIPAPPTAAEPDSFALPDGVAPDSPVGLVLRGHAVKQRAQQAKVDQLKLAEQALSGAEERTAKRQEEIAKRQGAARKRLDEQNAQIQSALKAGPGTSWRGVAAAGLQALGAVLGAAFDRSGTLQKQLPQTMDAIVGEWQQRMQGDFARQIQALQVGREGVQDELDAAMDEDRKLEQASAAARVAILEEANAQIQLAGEEGRLDLMELERLGIPQQMAAELEKAKADAAAKLEEDERKRITDELKLADMEAGIRYKEEQIKGERADRAKQFAELDIARQRLALDKDRSGALKEQDRLEAEKKKLDILKEQGLIDDRNLAKAVPLPGGSVLVANSAEQARDFSSQVASAEILGGLLDRIAVKLETGTDQFWASPEAQRLLSDYNAAVLATKDAEVLGAIQGADMGLIEGGLGPDPSKISLSNLRSQAPRIRQTRDNLGRKINARARSISSKWSAEGGTIELPRFEAPTDAVPDTPEDARGMLLPGTAGARPRIGAGKGDVKPEDFDAALKTVRNVAAKSVGGDDHDAIVRVQAAELAGALEQARSERDRIERERVEVTKRRAVLSKLGGPKAREFEERERALTEEAKTVQEYEKRIAEALKRERRLLWQKAGDPKLRGRDADRAVLKRVESLIGPVAGKPGGGR
jgi:hypothetical protein